MHGKVLTVRHQAVNRRKDNRFAVALDSEQNNIHVKDIVKVIDGPHSVTTRDKDLLLYNRTTLEEVNILVVIRQGREGEIRHIFRGFAFLHCKKLVENGGMFVCKARHLVLAGGSKVGLFHYICGLILHISKLHCCKTTPFCFQSPEMWPILQSEALLLWVHASAAQCILAEVVSNFTKVEDQGFFELLEAQIMQEDFIITSGFLCQYFSVHHNVNAPKV